MLIYYNVEIKGSFEQACEADQMQVMDIVAQFHHRDGVKHEDGSCGTVKITNREFNDCLAYMLGRGLNDH